MEFSHYSEAPGWSYDVVDEPKPPPYEGVRPF